jgi:hypothetical protein
MRLKIMNKLVCLTFGCILAGFQPSAAFAARVTVVHGINGGDLGLPSNLPVDIAVNGTCAIKGLTFTQTTQVELAGGSYSVTVHPANGSCANSPVITQSVSVPSSARYIGLVANLSDAAVPKLTAFVNDQPYRRSVFVNNAASNSRFFAGAGPRQMIFYYANPLLNGEGIMALAVERPARLSVNLIEVGRKRAFFKESFRATQSRAFYVLGSKKSGLRVISETLGE